MAFEGYALCLGTDTGAIQVPLDDNGRVTFFDGSQSVAILNVPNAPPPSGLFPIGNAGPLGETVYVAFCLTSLSVEAIGNFVRGRFHDEAAECFQVVQYDNGPKVVPDPEAGPWAYVAVTIGQGSEIHTGDTGDTRVDGVLRVEIRDRIGVGDGEMHHCADHVDMVFRAVQDAPIRYGLPELRTVGADQSTRFTQTGSRSGSSWWRVDVVVPFATDRPMGG